VPISKKLALIILETCQFIHNKLIQELPLFSEASKNKSQATSFTNIIISILSTQSYCKFLLLTKEEEKYKEQTSKCNDLIDQYGFFFVRTKPKYSHCGLYHKWLRMMLFDFQELEK